MIGQNRAEPKINIFRFREYTAIDFGGGKGQAVRPTALSILSTLPVSRLLSI